MASHEHASRDHIAEFLMGLFIGLATGGLIAVLLAPRSGKESRDTAVRFAKNLPGSIREDLNDPQGKTRSFIDRKRYQIEGKLHGLQESRQASRMAKAKRREEEATHHDDYEP
mgnify:FL=1